jgi:hypothetical protein
MAWRGNGMDSAYMPYLSDDEEELAESELAESELAESELAESEVGSETDQEEEEKTQDARFALLRAPTQQRGALGSAAVDYSYEQWDPTTNITTLENHVYLDPPKTTKTSLVCIKSINRDKSVYPSPYRFQIKLPRTYKNVTKFQLVQLSFPNGNSQNVSQAALLTSSIVRNLIDRGIPSTCISDCISLIDCSGGVTTSGLVEQGRLTPSGEPLLVPLSIPEGSGGGGYTENQMAQELTLRANSTPPFHMISYEAFRDVFMTTRNPLCLFNEPSDCYYSRITHRKYGAHTKEDIMGAYYTQAHIDSLPEISERIAFNAYYYPVLKEMLTTQRAEPFLQTDVIPYAEVVQRVLGVFEGLDSEFYYQMGQRNRGALEVYRRHFTFQYRNINKYICSYHEQQRRCTIVHDTLHPSLLRDIAVHQTYFMDQQLALAGLDTFSFRTLKEEVGQTSSVVRHMVGCVSTLLAGWHLLSGVTYSGGEEYRGTESTLQASALEADEEFSSMFRMTSSFGGIQGMYPGVIGRFSTFTDYHSTLSSYYQLYQSTQSTVSTIHGFVYEQLHRYVSTTYTGVLPQTMLDQRTYLVPHGVPVQFIPGRSVYIPGESVLDAERQVVGGRRAGAGLGASAIEYMDVDCKAICCSTLRGMIAAWYSCLPTNFILQTMTYRLGLINTTPTQFNFLSTVMDVTSTGNLNLYMNINDEQGFNNMDVTMPENYMVSNETTGQVKLMCAKILMGQLGDTGISQTVIQNPSLFENGLGKLDRLDIKIYYDDQNLTPAWVYHPYNLDFLEWNATFQVDEEVGFANRATGWGSRPTIPVPRNPDHTPFLGFTHKNNPNNS